jgi:hypothetical protein
MNKFVRIITIAAFTFVLHACGGVHHTVITDSPNIPKLKEVELLTVEVNSKEQTSEALSKNNQLKEIATEEIQALLNAKNIIAVTDSDTTINCHIDIVYGSRALRYFVGFGAGSGHISVTVELKNNDGNVLYATNSEADLSIGVFGGDFTEVAGKTIVEAINEFGSQL